MEVETSWFQPPEFTTYERYHHYRCTHPCHKKRILPKACPVIPVQPSGKGYAQNHHKIHGPKGVGFLYISEKAKVRPIIYGGGQQKGMRSGTENVPGIAGMARAVEEIFVDFDAKINYLYGLKEQFIKGVRMIDGIRMEQRVGVHAFNQFPCLLNRLYRTHLIVCVHD